MKIIFNSTIEFEQFAYKAFCPSTFGLVDRENCTYERGLDDHVICYMCWKNSGLNYEIDKRRPLTVIFDSKKEWDTWVNDICPSILNLKDSEGCGKGNTCDICWRNSGLNYEVLDIFMGMTKLPFEDNGIYIPIKESIQMTNQTTNKFTYTDAVYELIKDECKGLDSIYEDYIVKLVGNCGLAALKRANLIESCGVLNCRQLYVLCDKK